MRLILASLDENRQPQTFISYPTTISDEIKGLVNQLLIDNINRGFFSEQFPEENLITANFAASLDSEWAPRNSQSFIISAIVESHFDPKSFEPILKECVRKIQMEPLFYKAFFRFSKKNKYDPEIKDQFRRLRDSVSFCLDDLNRFAQTLSQGDIIVVGPENTGKTSLVQLLMNDGEFPENVSPSNEIVSLDIFLGEMTFTFHDIPPKVLKTDEWQEECPNPKGAIIVVDLTLSKDKQKEIYEEYMDYFKDLFSEENDFTENFPILVLGNKMEELKKVKEKNITSMIKASKFTKIYQNFPVSLKTGEGLKPATQWLSQMILSTL